MTDLLRHFCQETSGAVTVDWIVLTAAVVGLSIAAAAGIQSGAVSLGDNVGTFLTTDEVFPQNQ